MWPQKCVCVCARARVREVGGAGIFEQGLEGSCLDSMRRGGGQCASPPHSRLEAWGWDELRASGWLGLVEELALGSGLCLERGTTHLRMLFSLGLLPITTPFPPTFQKAELPQPLLARILLSGGLGSHHPAASMWLKQVIIHHWRASPPTPRPDLNSGLLISCEWNQTIILTSLASLTQ